MHVGRAIPHEPRPVPPCHQGAGKAGEQLGQHRVQIFHGDEAGPRSSQEVSPCVRV